MPALAADSDDATRSAIVAIGAVAGDEIALTAKGKRDAMASK